MKNQPYKPVNYVIPAWIYPKLLNCWYEPRRIWNMDIGKPIKEHEIVPATTPVPSERDRETVETPVSVPDKNKVPAGTPG